MEQKPQKVFIDVVGCPENRWDAGQLASLLEKNDAVLVENPAEADTLIVNTCGLTRGNEKISQDIITRVKAHSSPGSRLVICGCLPKINLPALEEFTETLIVPGPMLDNLPWILTKQRDCRTDFNPQILPQRRILKKENIWTLKKSPFWIFDRLMYLWAGITPPGRKRFFIKIASGCNHHCTYCAIKISRGRLTSMPPEWVKERIAEGVRAGYRDINLLGTNVSAYGKDIGTNLAALLKDIIKIDDSIRLHLRNCEPEDLLDCLPELQEVLRTGKIKYLEMPLQSGSDRILKRMNRGYKTADYIKVFNTLKEAYPKLHIRSQAMVGFPGETEEDFKQTLDLASRLPFLYVETFHFSVRPGTAAEKLDGKLDKKSVMRRYHILQKRLQRAQLGSKLRFGIQYLLS